MNTNSESYRESHKSRGADYHKKFTDGSYRSLLWRFEQEILKRVIEHHFSSPPALLDFACGTGRVISFLSPSCRSAIGVDVSESMLEVARNESNGYSVVRADLTREDVLKDEPFDLVTAFRFFPNAEQELRRDALAAMRGRMKPGGILVFNNHKNSFSALYLIASAMRGKRQGMRANEVMKMLNGGGFEVIETHHIGVLPATDRFQPLPIRMASWIESVCMKVPAFRNVSSDVIYVCRAVGDSSRVPA